LALRYVLTNPNADVALSGMENLKMLEENVEVASRGEPLSKEEVDKIEIMVEENKKLGDSYCTGCKYCVPCDQGINIPHIFSLMNYHRMYGLTGFAAGEYKKLYLPMDKRYQPWEPGWGYDVSKCTECGICEEKCPQKIKIIEQLKETHALLG
jgi:predicted aldo/keto reductase-like oxidoreductase